MKAIEKKIINYLKNNDFLDYPKLDNLKNLSLRDSVDISSNKKYVYLWGIGIFSLDRENNIQFSFRGWQTNTTKRRINALLYAFSSCSVKIYQKNYSLFLASSAGVFPIDADKFYIIKNGKPEEIKTF